MPTWTTPHRSDPPHDPVDERTALDDRLDFQRTTLLLKCGGLTPEQLAEQSVPPSNLSLLGLIRHMSAVESWFHSYDGQPDHPFFWNYVLGETDGFEDIDVDRAADDLASTTRASSGRGELYRSASCTRRSPMRTSPCVGSTCT